jgi:hypothetical protein
MIDTTIVKGTNHFYKLGDLVEEFGLDVPERARQHIR